MKDSVLIHLTTALDTASMQAVFQESLFGGLGPEAALRVRDCQIERIRYKPAKNCLVCYRLQIENSAGQLLGEQLLNARLYERGGSQRRFVRAQNASLAPPAFGPPLLHLPALDMVVWLFPNDRKLHGLPGLVNPDHLRTVLLAPLIAEHVGPHWQIVNLVHHLVHYNPEHTAMMQVQLQLQHRQSGERRPYLLFGKTYYNDEGQETYRVMRHLWQQAHTATIGNGVRSVPIAQPLAYHSELNLLWQQGLAGQTLSSMEMDSDDFYDGLERAAATVAALHQAPISGVRSCRLESWVAKLGEMRAWLPAVLPSCRSELEPLVDGLLAQLPHLGRQPLATLHGDLHLQNFFLHGAEVALIDLDNVCSGSPWQDVGSFIAGLLAHGLYSGLPRSQVDEMVAAFLHSYCRHVPWEITPQNLSWFVAVALINERAFRSITRLKEGRLDLVHELVALAAQVSRSNFAEAVWTTSIET